jgi:CBS domain-containing protein
MHMATQSSRRAAGRSHERAHEPVAHVRADASLARAVAVLRDRAVDSAVVVDRDGRAVAMVTARGICLAALRTNKPLSDLVVEQAMARTIDDGTGPGLRQLRQFVRYATGPCSAAGRASSAGSAAPVAHTPD